MKRMFYLSIAFCQVFFIFIFASGLFAKWTPGSNVINEKRHDERSSNFTLSLEEPLKWKEAGITLFELNTYGGWDVGYRYHFYYK